MKNVGIYLKPVTEISYHVQQYSLVPGVNIW